MPNFGWIPSPEEVERIVASLPRPVFGLAAPDVIAADEPQDFLFFEAEVAVLGYNLPANDQDGVGCCVGEGYSRDILDLLFIEIAQNVDGESEEYPVDAIKDWPAVAVESVYGPSRVEIGGGRINGDGSVGAWAAKAVNQYGCLFYGKDYGGVKLSPKDYTKIRDWGRRGMPDNLEPAAREHIVRTVSLVTSGEHGWKANRNGYPTPVCSNQGFSQTRDSKGFCKPEGSWAHCMGTAGGGTAKGNRPFVLLRQSWGPSGVRGPNKLTLETGREVLLPEGVFAIDLEVYARMVREQDTFALSAFLGFKRRKPKWYV